MSELKDILKNYNDRILNDIKKTYFSSILLKDYDTKEIPQNAETTAEEIKNNLNSLTIDDFNLLLSLHRKTLTNDKIIRDLLNHELLYYEPKMKISNIDELILSINKLIKRYEYCLSYSIYEDSEWIIKYESDRKFKSNENQIMLLNTLKEEYINDSQTNEYLNNLVKNFRKYVNENEYHIKFKVWEDEDNDVYWVIFVLTNLKK
jgi:hypothetical protein